MKMKKSLVLFLLLAMVVSLAGCSGSGDKNGGADANESKIGINYELTGAVASWESSVNGILMAFDEINAAGGINGMKIVPVNLIISPNLLKQLLWQQD